MEESHKRIWQGKWGFIETNIIVWGLVIIGFLLNYSLGNFDFYFLERPYNFIIGGLIILIICIIIILRKYKIFKWFYSIELSISLLIAITLLCIIMGLTRQQEVLNNPDLFEKLGFRSMTSAWSFVLVYLMLMLSLGSAILKRLISKSKKKLMFSLNHIGLWMVLFFSALGYSDLQKYIIHVNKGEMEWRVYGSNGEMIELPIAIKLNDFIIEEYIPKLAIINRNSGEIIKNNRNPYLQIDTNGKPNRFNEYEIIIHKYIHNSMPESDSCFRYTPMLGSSPSAQLSIRNLNKKDNIIRGWVSAGNAALISRPLNLDNKYAIVMTPAEPKAFISNIEVFTQDEKYKKDNIEVNKPMRIGYWNIYQYGYDNSLGKMSNYSSFELVYDPWLRFVYLGIILIGLGSLFLIVFGKKTF